MSHKSLTVEYLSQPAREPITVNEAAAQARADLDPEIQLVVAGYISAARGYVEDLIDGTLLTCRRRAGYEYDSSGFRELILPSPPLQQVERVYFLHGDGSETEISPSNYTISRSSRLPSFLRFHSQQFAPRNAGVTPLYVEFTAGFGYKPEDVPAQLRYAVSLVVDDWFNNTAMADSVSNSENVQKAVARLIAPFKHLNI